MSGHCPSKPVRAVPSRRTFASFNRAWIRHNFPSFWRENDEHYRTAMKIGRSGAFEVGVVGAKTRRSNSLPNRHDKKIGLCEPPHSGGRRRMRRLRKIVVLAARALPKGRSPHASHHFHPVLRNCPDLHSGMRLRAKPSARHSARHVGSTLPHERGRPSLRARRGANGARKQASS